MSPQPGIPLTDAQPRDLDPLAAVIASAFHDLPPSRWLIPDPARRHHVFPAYFRLLLDHAAATGKATRAVAGHGVALWIPSGSAALPDYARRLAEITGDRLPWFTQFDELMEARHPGHAAGDHDWLAILAVAPGHQGQGTGSALLRARHQVLDTLRRGSYLEAASSRARALYLRHGYTDHGDPIGLPGGPVMYPMWRDPKPLAAP